ncbi:hypothetical protein F4805DRAFT_461536 [Annulohypoxylon moriforme]|nr:hypothetical protein F4805DRAFT_461536 [Annulohypoxylon moriforme]
MALDTGDWPGQWERREKWREAREKGHELISTLHSNTPDAAFVDMREIYFIKKDEFSYPKRALGYFQRTLRRLNIDTNRLSFCEVYSPNKLGHIALSRSDARSGILMVWELERKHDENPPGKRLPMSEVLWQSYVQDAVANELPPSRLRVVRSTTDRIVQINEAKMRIEYTRFDYGYHAMIGSQLGQIIIRMLTDHREEVGKRTIERIFLVGFKSFLNKKANQQDLDVGGSFHMAFILSGQNEIPPSQPAPYTPPSLPPMKF